MKSLHALLAILLLLLASAAAIASLDGCVELDKPIPINPTKDAPCGNGAYYECPDHGCCLAYTEECTGRHECRYVGEEPLFGAGRDGGAKTRPELTPDEARKAAPR